MGTVSLVQKCQTSGCSGHSRIVVYGGGDIVFGTKRSNQWMHWMQYTADTPPYTTIPLHPLCPLHTASIVSTGLTFLHQRQCPDHHIPPFHCVLHPLCKYFIHYLLHLLCTASIASTGLTFLHQRQCPHYHIPLFHCVHCVLHHCIHCFDLFASKTMSPPPYTTIPLHTVSTA